MLLNGDFALAQAEAFAERVRKEAGADPKAQAERAWKLAYLREPTEKELAGALAFLNRVRQRPGQAQGVTEYEDATGRRSSGLARATTALTGLACRLLLFVDEFAGRAHG